MKKYFVLIFAMIITGICFSAVYPDGGPYAQTVDGVRYYFLVSNGEAIIGTGKEETAAIPKTTSGAINIPSTLGGCPVTTIGHDAFYGCRSVTSITIPEGVTSIDYLAFCNCSSLTSVMIPSSVTSIGKYAFRYCSLSSIDIPEGITEIASYTFDGCNYLEEIMIPSSITSIGDYAFNNCRSLKSITISNGVTSIGGYAFYGCSSLTSVTIPSSVTSISSYTFYGCSSLTTVTIPEGVTSVGKDAFCNCSSLTSVMIPSSVTSIDLGAFALCKSLPSITIPEGVTSVGKDAFCNCSSLTSVMIPSSVTSIGETAFSGCSSLTSVTIHGGEMSVGEKAFYKCESLNAVHISDPADWCSISFADCYANPCYYANHLYLHGEEITELVIPEGVNMIGSYAFCGCNALMSVTISSSVTSIESNAFYSCGSLAEVHITDLAKWCEISFASKTSNPCYYARNMYLNDEKITRLQIPAGVTRIGDYAFCYCTSITSVTIPNGVTTIGDYAFYYCTSITSITIPNSVSSIGDWTFGGCKSLNKVHISDLAKWCAISFGGVYSNPCEFAGHLYLNGEEIKKLVIPEGVTSIESKAFYGCTALTSVTIPSSVTSIEYSAFSGCNSMKSVTIPDSVTSIEGSAFYGCSSLTSVTIPKNIKLIDRSVFSCCSSLTSVTIPNGVTEIGSNAFDGCSSLKSVTIPPSVQCIRLKAFAQCYELNAVHISDLAKWCTISYLGETDIYDYSCNPCCYAHNLYLNGEKITDLVIPGDVEEIYGAAFYNCSFKSVVFSEGVKSIGTIAFMRCSMESVTIPSSMKNIHEGAFYLCDLCGLNAVHISDIAKWCEISVSIYKNANPCSVASHLYLNNKEITELVIPYGVTTIREGVFYGCSTLESVTIPSSVRLIDRYAFCNCSALKSLTIPSSVKTIERYAFYNCSSLQTIYVDSGDDGRVKGLLKGMGLDLNAIAFIARPSIEGDATAEVTGDAENGFVIKSSEETTDVVITIPKGIAAEKVTVEVSPSVQSVKANGATIKVVKGAADITEFLDIPAAVDGVVNLGAAVVKPEIVKEALDTEKGAVVELSAEEPTLTTAETKPGLTYTLLEGATLESMGAGASKLGDGTAWTPEITVKGGKSGFYTIKVTK